MTDPRHLTEDSADCLRRILDPDVDVVIWRRRGGPEMTRLFRLNPAPEDFPHVTFVTTADGLADALRQRDALQRAYWKPIADDVTAMVCLYVAVAGVERVRVRLEYPKDDGCRLFHVDNVRLRLVVTYLGPGTEWIAEPDLVRDGLERGDNALVMNDGKLVIRRVPRFSVAMLKGEKFTGVRKSGAVHRSPPIAAERLQRFLVVIDDVVDT